MKNSAKTFVFLISKASFPAGTCVSGEIVIVSETLESATLDLTVLGMLYLGGINILAAREIKSDRLGEGVPVEKANL